MDLQFIAHGSSEWVQARQLRYLSFFQSIGLPESVMDDDKERIAVHLVAVNGDEVVGYGRLVDLGNAKFDVSQMVVAPTHQRRGIGAALLEALIGRARSSGGKIVELKARLSAVGFYQSAGFQKVGESFLSDKTGIPHVNMMLILGCQDA